VKTLWAPPGLGTLVSDVVVVVEVDLGDGSVGLQHICECLSGRKREVDIASCEDPTGTDWPRHPRF